MTNHHHAIAWARYGAFLMFLAVVLGAFGGHVLRAKLSPDQISIYETAVLFHMVHALGILAAAWLFSLTEDLKVLWAERMFLVGIFLFSGSLYLLAVTRAPWLGIITPLGGLAWLAGWLLLALTKKKI